MAHSICPDSGYRCGTSSGRILADKYDEESAMNVSTKKRRRGSYSSTERSISKA